jgi:hypothetical protein
MKKRLRFCLYCLSLCAFTIADAGARQVDADSYQSIIEALQFQSGNHPAVFPMEALDGGVQSIPEGLQAAYFGFAERRFSDRLDFHLSIDVAYFPNETGDVKTADGSTRKVRAPATYLKKIYAIQDGLLISAARNSTGFKIILKHTLDKPYLDSQGREYRDYYTSYRHVDERSLAHLTLVAQKALDNDVATYEDLIGKHVFKAGEVIAFVGFDPNTQTGYPRSHLDFSLHVFADPTKGSNIRRYSINPLLLFPVFEYADPGTYRMEAAGMPAYRFVVDGDSIVPPRNGKDGRFRIAIPAGGVAVDGPFTATRYFALNAMQVAVSNGGRALATHTLDRDRRLGYEPASYDELDNPDRSRPYFAAPLDAQGDVYEIEAVLPGRWFQDIGYDWSKDGSISIKISSIWAGALKGHAESFEIPLPAR